MKKSFILLAILIASCSLFAQKPYSNSVGGIVGFNEGFSYKGFVMDQLAIEAEATVAGWQFHDIHTNVKLSANVMFEKSIKSGWYWFVGGGLNGGLGFDSYVYGYKDVNGNYYHGNAMFDNTYTRFFFGINAIAGAEYKFAKIPLTLQADLRPGVAFYSRKYYKWDGEYVKRTEMRPAFDYTFLNISARYTF